MGGLQFQDRLIVKVTDSLSFNFKGEKQYGFDIRYVLPELSSDTVEIAQQMDSSNNLELEISNVGDGIDKTMNGIFIG